jgi:hypothetical protein
MHRGSATVVNAMISQPVARLWCLLFLAVLSAAARAEVFVLKTGGQIEGQHLNPTRDRGEPYQVRTDEGIRLSLADSLVVRVIVKSDLDKQYEAALAKLENTAEAQWNMAEWCKEAGLIQQRKRHLQAVVAIDPNHVEARKALGYQRYGSRWLTQEEFMAHNGYVRYKGAWRLRQEIEIESRESQQEIASKQLRREIRRWFDQLGGSGRLAEAADRNLSSINDPAAAPALAEIVGDAKHSRTIRLRALDMLAKLPPGQGTLTLVRVVLNDSDAGIQDACLDELKRAGTHTVLPIFLGELKNKENKRVNRAAECLQSLGDKNATLPLINALITKHQTKIQLGGPPGSTSGSFSPGGGPGSGGIAMGNTTKIIDRKLENSAVLSALTALYPGVNYQYDVEAWRRWYIQTQTTSNVNLRRDD